MTNVLTESVWRGLLLCCCCLGMALPLRGDERGTGANGAGTAVVLELAFLDFVGTAAAKETVAVRVLSDGTVLLPSHDGARLVPRDRLTAAQMAQLMEDAVTRTRLTRIDSEQLERGITAACRLAGLSTEIVGAATTIIRHHHSDGGCEVRCAALSVAAARFPDMTDVQQLFHAQLRLQNVAAVAQAGGVQASERLAALVNRELRTAHPDSPPMTSRELSMVRELSTGSRYVQFYRRPLPPGEELLVSVFESPGEPPRIDILAAPTLTPQ